MNRRVKGRHYHRSNPRPVHRMGVWILRGQDGCGGNNDNREDDSMMLTEIVKRALTETVTDIGQLSPAEKRQLNAAVKRGHLSRGKGGPFPVLKTVWAVAGHDFAAERKRYVDEAMAIAEWESRHGYSERGRCLNLNCDHGKEATP